MALLDRAIVFFTGLMPRSFVWRIAKRYVAGKDLDSAVAAVKELNSLGCSATFDLLGEFIENLEQGKANAESYLGILDRIQAEDLNANVSVKLTSFGLLLDEAATLEQARRVVGHAKELGIFVRLDMEDSPCTDATFRILRTLREEGFANVGVAIQAYLRRTLDDIEALADLKPNYRLCKGIYVEPEKIAFKGADEIRRNYEQSLAKMFAGAASKVGIATHDALLVDAARALLNKRDPELCEYEFQMLLGVTETLRAELVAEGHDLRVYVPYGEDWYGYSMRRLKENPRMGRIIAGSLFRRS